MRTLRVVTSHTATETIYVSAKELAVRWNMVVDAARDRACLGRDSARHSQPSDASSDAWCVLPTAVARSGKFRVKSAA